MAQRITVEIDCEIHLKEEDAQVPGVQEVIWDQEASKPRFLDMCGVCKKLPYEEVLKYAKQYGVFEVSTNGAKRVATKKENRARPSRNKGPREAVCPVCGDQGLAGKAGDTQSRGIVQHALQAHPEAYAHWNQYGVWPPKASDQQ